MKDSNIVNYLLMSLNKVLSVMTFYVSEHFDV